MSSLRRRPLTGPELRRFPPHLRQIVADIDAERVELARKLDVCQGVGEDGPTTPPETIET